MRAIYSVLKSSSFGLLPPLVFLVGTCVLVLIFSFSLSLISYYTKLYANWLSDPRWYHFYFNWCNCYCYSFPIPPFVALAWIWWCPELSLRLIGAPTVPQRLVHRSHEAEFEWPVFSSTDSYDQETGQRLYPYLQNVLNWLSITPHTHFILLSIRAYGTYRPYLNI